MKLSFLDQSAYGRYNFADSAWKIILRRSEAVPATGIRVANAFCKNTGHFVNSDSSTSTLHS